MAQVACYKCGAHPGHSNKRLDVLKLFKCLDCGTVACIPHRKGMVGGECEECGSTRFSTIMGGKGKDQSGGAVAGGGSGSGGGSAPAAEGSNDRAVSASQLKSMQTERINAEKEVAQRKEDAQRRAIQNQISAQQRKEADEAEKAVQALLGDKKVIMDHSAEELVSKINKHLPDGVSLAGLKKEIDDDNKQAVPGETCSISDKQKHDEKSKKAKKAKQMISNAMSKANIKNEIQSLMDSQAMSQVSDVSADTSLVGVHAQNMVAVIKNAKKVKKKKEYSKNENEKELTKDESEKELTKDEMISVTKAQRVHKIKLLDSFCVKADKSISLQDVIVQRENAEQNIAKYIENEFDLEGSTLELTLKVNNFIPLDHIDHLLNLRAEDLKEKKVNIITGIIAQNLTFDTEGYLDQFALILPQKSYIKGIYASFAINEDYTLEEQREINLKLLDMAQENDKFVYLGISGCPISHWKSIFDEYDLSEIQFVYTDIITSSEELEFIKENNIRVLIRPDVDFAYYAEILKDYNNICFGSAFVKSAGDNPSQEEKNSGILTKILKSMSDIDKNFIEKLLNI